MYNVMLVDDEPRSIDAIEANVDWRRSGIRKVFKAMNMSAAIEIVQKNEVDIMICDIEMPNGSGLNLLEWLREHDFNIKCIFVTCHPEFDYMRKAIQLMCYDYILKPIHYEEFERVLNDLVKKMELLDSGEKDIEAIHWGGMTDFAIREQSLKAKERNVELEVKKYIREHMTDDINVKDIAETLHFNAQYLMRSFKSKTGYCIMEYITKTRMETSKKLLKDTDLPVKEVATLLGYGDYAYFTRVFRKEFGVSPTKFRNQPE